MIEFDLERAKDGDKVTTRDGRTVRLFCFDWATKCGNKILGGVMEPSGTESVVTWLLSGGYYSSLKVSDNDLVMAPRMITKYYNVYKRKPDGSYYDTRGKAVLFAALRPDYIETREVTWQE